MSKAKDATIRVRVRSALRERLLAIADAREIDLSDVVREALNQYMPPPSTLRESGSGYTAPPQSPPEPPVKLRNAIAPLRVPTAFYVVKRASKVRSHSS